MGDFVFLDLDSFAADGKTLTGKSDGKLDEADKTFIGSPIPDFTYGLNISLTYKNFDFAAFLRVFMVMKYLMQIGHILTLQGLHSKKSCGFECLDS